MLLPVTEFAPFYQNYVQLAGGHIHRHELEKVLMASQSQLDEVFKNVSDAQLPYRYAPNKWTVAEVLQHLLDCELIFLARALHIAREPNSVLPGFDENVFQTHLVPENHLQRLLADLRLQRQLSLTVLRRISDESLTFTGTANGNLVSVRALFNMLAGHSLHHVNILKERYLLSQP